MATYQEPDIIELRKARPSRLGIDPFKRTIDELLQFGIFNIDKPSGPTSHQVSYYLKRILKSKKTGHSGTLDPKVTGVLPIAVGRGTRVVQALLPAGKQYVCLIHMHKPVPKTDLEKAFTEFTGRIKQLPPVKSAVKRQVRERNIYSLKLLDFAEQDALFIVDCQAGTYIRKLCHDIGERLGVGAHMKELRRTRAGPFTEDTLCTLQDVADAMHYQAQGDEKPLRKILLPGEQAVSHMKKIWVLDSTVDSLCHGMSLKVPGVAQIHKSIEYGEPVAIMTHKQELIGLAKARMSSKDMQKYTSGICAKMEHVFMMPGIYPKIE